MYVWYTLLNTSYLVTYLLLTYLLDNTSTATHKSPQVAELLQDHVDSCSTHGLLQLSCASVQLTTSSSSRCRQLLNMSTSNTDRIAANVISVMTTPLLSNTAPASAALLIGTVTHRHHYSSAPLLIGTITHRHHYSSAALLIGTITHRHHYSSAALLVFFLVEIFNQ